MADIVAATDGSCLGNPGPGGWAWIAEDGRNDSAGARHTSNNRMELRAVRELLQAIDPQDVLIVQTDSAYVVGVFTKWLPLWRSKGMRNAKGKSVENLDLVSVIADLLIDRHVSFQKVPAHTGHPLNEAADSLALAAAQRAQAKLRAL